MSIPMLRLPRLACSIRKLIWPVLSAPPTVSSPRCASPRVGCSTLITSAPQSASTAPADGTNVYSATSRTRTPSITRCMRRSPSRETDRTPQGSASRLSSGSGRAREQHDAVLALALGLVERAIGLVEEALDVGDVHR